MIGCVRYDVAKLRNKTKKVSDFTKRAKHTSTPQTQDCSDWLDSSAGQSHTTVKGVTCDVYKFRKDMRDRERVH